jgi:transposase
MSPLIFVGIDVSQAHLDIAVRPGASFSIAHHESAIATLVEQLRPLSPTLILLEATGGMEIPLTSALATAELPVVVVNPRQVRDFAKASGRLAKTDALDAQMLAQFAEVMRPQPRPLPDAEARALTARWPDAGNGSALTEAREESSRVPGRSGRGCGPYRLARTGLEEHQHGVVRRFATAPVAERRPAAGCAGVGYP